MVSQAMHMAAVWPHGHQYTQGQRGTGHRGTPPPTVNAKKGVFGTKPPKTSFRGFQGKPVFPEENWFSISRENPWFSLVRGFSPAVTGGTPPLVTCCFDACTDTMTMSLLQ